MKVWTLHIEHRHGDDVTVYASHEEAMNAADAYVESWWVDEMAGKPMPDGASERVAAYFDFVEDEYYGIDEANLDCGLEQMLLALRAALPELDQEVDARKHSGNDEYWRGLEIITDQVRAAIKTGEACHV